MSESEHWEKYGVSNQPIKPEKWIYCSSQPVQITKEYLEQSRQPPRGFILQQAETKKLRVPLETAGLQNLLGMAGREVSDVSIDKVDDHFEIRIYLKEKIMPAAPTGVAETLARAAEACRGQVWQNSWSPSDPLVFVRVKMCKECIVDERDLERLQRCELLDPADLKSLPEQPEGTALYHRTFHAHEAGSETSVAFHSLFWIKPPTEKPDESAE